MKANANDKMKSGIIGAAAGVAGTLLTEEVLKQITPTNDTDENDNGNDSQTAAASQTEASDSETSPQASSQPNRTDQAQEVADASRINPVDSGGSAGSATPQEPVADEPQFLASVDPDEVAEGIVGGDIVQGDLLASRHADPGNIVDVEGLFNEDDEAELFGPDVVSPIDDGLADVTDDIEVDPDNDDTDDYLADNVEDDGIMIDDLG